MRTRHTALQFGFITLFVVAFPLGPFFALINNAVEIRTDSYKLITKLQRPTAKPAEDIGKRRRGRGRGRGRVGLGNLLTHACTRGAGGALGCLGSWYTVLNALSVLAVITNSFLVAFSSAWLKEVIINGITYYQITVRTCRARPARAERSGPGPFG